MIAIGLSVSQPRATTERQMIEQRIGRRLGMLVDVIGGIEARMRVAQFGRTHLQIVQQRMLPGIRHVRVVRKVPGAVEEAVRIAALGRAVVHEMVQRFGPGGGYIRVA